MNGAHDLGGQHGFGPIAPEPDEPVFHHEWERRAMALTVLMGAVGGWTIDQSRAARESLPPVQYLSSSYYEIWIAALEKLMLERGLVSEAELIAGRALDAPSATRAAIAADAVEAVLRRGGPTERAAQAAARFAVGDTVRTKVMNPVTHTRLPRYARGRSGTVVSVHGAHVYPDKSGVGQGEDPQWLYTVRFDAHELWGGRHHGVRDPRRLLGTLPGTGVNGVRSVVDAAQVDSIADAIAACGLPESTGAAFAEPWQAQLFAMTIALHEAGRFTWPEWVGYLSQSIRDANAAGDPDLGATYWQHWLDAFERLLRDRDLAGPLELAARRESIRAYSRVARSASIMRADRDATPG